MTPGEAKFLDWAFMILGVMLVFSGLRTIARRRTKADGRAYEDSAAARLGWLWIVLGLLLVGAALTDIAILKSFSKLFMEATS